MTDGHEYFPGCAGKSRLELDEIITQRERAGGVKPEIENDLVVFDILARHLHALIDSHGHIGREAVIGAPLIECPYQVGTC